MVITYNGTSQPHNHTLPVIGAIFLVISFRHYSYFTNLVHAYQMHRLALERVDILHKRLDDLRRLHLDQRLHNDTTARSRFAFGVAHNACVLAGVHCDEVLDE